MSDPISPNMGLYEPVVGVSPDPVWASELTTNMGTIDVHNHTSGQGVKVPTAGININANLSFSGYSATSLAATTFTEQSGVAAANSLWFKTTGDLWVTNGAGSEFQLTSGTSINYSLVGAWTGLVSPATAYYNAGTTTFSLLQSGSIASNAYYGEFGIGAISIYDSTQDNVTYPVTIKSPTSLAGSPTIILPSYYTHPIDFSSLTPQAYTAPLTISSTGVIGDTVQNWGILGAIGTTASLTWNTGNAQFFLLNSGTPLASPALANVNVGTLLVWNPASYDYAVAVENPTGLGSQSTLVLPSVNITMPTAHPASTNPLLINSSGGLVLPTVNINLPTSLPASTVPVLMSSSGVMTTSANATPQPAILTFGAENGPGVSTTSYLTVGGSIIATVFTNVAVAYVVMPFSGTITAMYARVGTASTGGGSYNSFYVYQNGNQTSMTFNINAGGTTGSTTSNPVTFSAGDLITVQVAASSGVSGAFGNCTCSLALGWNW